MEVKAAVFSDFDGTITLQDSNDYLTDHFGLGKQKRLEVFAGVIAGTKPFRTGFKEMLDSVKLPLDKCVEELLANIELDPGFNDMIAWCHSEGIPLVVISSGMKPVIEALIAKLIRRQGMAADALDIEIVANDVVTREDGSWEIVYRDDTPHGHDKSRSINQYKKMYKAPRYYYCGDGISDLTAARECDVLFARAGRDLVPYCDAHGIDYVPFDSFTQIRDHIEKDIR